MNEIDNENENENEASRSEDYESEESKIEDSKIEDNKTTNDKIEDEVSNDNYEYKRYVPPQEFDPLKNNTLNLNTQYITCSICFVRFNKKSYVRHLRRYCNGDYKCQKCKAVFNTYHSIKRHLRIEGCKKKITNYKFLCNFCRRGFWRKAYIQCHLLHAHGNEINNIDKTQVREILSKKSTSNLSDVLIMKKINNSNNVFPKQLNNLTDTSEKELNSRVKSNNTSSPKLNGLNCTHLKSQCDTVSKKPKSLINSSSQLNYLCDTPSKKTKQTSLTDFISFYKEKSNNDNVIIEKVIGKNNNSVIDDTSEACQKFDDNSSLRNTKNIQAQKRTRSRALDKNKPFVQIHVNPRTMMLLLNNEIKSDLESLETSYNVPYNLRPSGENSYALRKFRDSIKHDTASNKTKHPVKKKYPCNVSTRRMSLRNKRFKSEIVIKECKIYLEKCDEMLKRSKIKTDKVKNVSQSLDLKEERVIKTEKVENSIKTESASNLSLKVTSEIFKAKANNLSIVKKESNMSENNIKISQKSFQCHVCKKLFSLKENLYEHMKLFHSIYMSSICNARYTSINKLLKHYLRQHIIFKRKECCVCYEKFDTPVSLKRHMIVHCLKTIRSKKDTLPVDVEINCSSSKKENKCKGCHKRFWLNSCLKEHEKVCRRIKDLICKQRRLQVKRSFSFRKESIGSKFNTIQAISSKQISSEQKMKSSINSITRTYSSPHVLPSVYSARATSKKRLVNSITWTKGYKVETSDKTTFPCTICGIQFQTFQNLCMHERTYSKPANKSCSDCGTLFPSKRLLQLHSLATHSPSCAENYQFFCKFCNQGFVKKTNIRIHERHFHMDQVPKPVRINESVWSSYPMCTTCNLLFESYERFIEHNMYYYNAQVFVCTVCGKSFQGMYKLHHHSKVEHYPNDVLKLYTYKCDICNEGFNYESHFHAHKLHVHLPDAPIIQKTLNIMQDHSYALTNNVGIRTKVTEEPIILSAKTYTCRVCNLNFTNEEDLSMHKIEYSMNGKFQCSKCNRKCGNGSFLAKHDSLNHTGCDINISFKCRFCGEVLTTSTAMLCHEKHFHLNCNSDMSNDDRQPVMDKKIDSRKLEKCDGFTCSTCNMKFHNNINLKQHLLEYADIGTFICNICQRKFTEVEQLEVHKIKHTMLSNTLLSQRCPICNEGFSDPVNVRSHVMHLHRYETFNFNMKHIGTK